MPTLGDLSPKKPKEGEKGEEKKKKIGVELFDLMEISRQSMTHIRQTIVDAGGREELPNQLQQFTELLNAAQALASTTKSVEEETLDNTKLLLQVLGYVLKTPELRDKLIEIIKTIGKKPTPPQNK